ncbi:MAG: phosphoesterase [Crenarchaeota archaeon]|nr:phosphoesterase [Thermoproteota archaeon]
MLKRYPRVFVGGDWDADGVVAAALLVYSQEKLGKYPIPSKAIVDRRPVDPERLKFILNDMRADYDLMILLDIPYTKYIPNILKLLKSHFGVKKIIYIDHHLSTISNIKNLESVIDEVIVDHKMPTAAIVEKLLREHDIEPHARLRSFVEVVKYMDSGRRVPQKYMKLFEMASLFSKALTVMRDEKVWIKIVDWLATPAALPMPLDQKILSKVREAIAKRDQEIKDMAIDLAMSAEKIGEIRFIDARNKWKHRGGTALASKIASIVKSPVALLVTTRKNYSLLIIKASGGKAYRIAKYLVAEGLGRDIAGHPNLAIVRVPKDPDLKKLKEMLLTAQYYTP